MCDMWCFICIIMYSIFFFKQKTAYDMRISDCSSDVCSSDLFEFRAGNHGHFAENFTGTQLNRRLVRQVYGDGARCHNIHGPAAPDLHANMLIGDRQTRLQELGYRLQGVSRQAFEQGHALRSEEHTSELQSLMRISYSVLCLKKTQTKQDTMHHDASNLISPHITR